MVAQRTAVEGLSLAPDTAGAGAAFGVRCRFRWSSDSSVVLEPVGFGARAQAVAAHEPPPPSPNLRMPFS